MRSKLLLLLLLLTAAVWPQDDIRYEFFVVETLVHRADTPISDKHPQERRWYISNLVAVPDRVRGQDLPKIVDKYFDEHVVQPLKKQGIVLDYYDNNLQINDGSVLAISTQEEVGKFREQALADHKAQSGNIYTFNWALSGDVDPKLELYYRDKKAPLYLPKGAKKP